MMELTYGLWSPTESTFCHDDCQHTYQMTFDYCVHQMMLDTQHIIYHTIYDHKSSKNTRHTTGRQINKTTLHYCSMQFTKLL